MSWKWSNHYPGHVAGFQPHYFGHHNHQMPQLPFSKPRLRWSNELHDKFVSAVNQLGGAAKATPKTIWNIMKVEGLTLFQIKSHLQKYRLGKTGRRLKTDFVAADGALISATDKRFSIHLRNEKNSYEKISYMRRGRRNVEDEQPENKPMDMEGYLGSSVIMNRDETILEAQKYGNLNHLVQDVSVSQRLTYEKSQTSVKSSEMMENPPPSTSAGMEEKDIASTENTHILLLSTTCSTREKDITTCRIRGDPHYFPELSDLLDGNYIMTHNSSSFSSFFDQVANFPNIEDDFMNDYDSMVNNNVCPYPGI